MIFHKDGTLPQNGEVWVFGSNFAGVHGAGAAKIADRVNCHDELVAALRECMTDHSAPCFSTDDKESMYRRIRAINQTVRAALQRAKT